MKTNKTKIQNNYFDALFFANATSTEKLPFHISPAEFKLLIKLVHYHNDQINITWTSENISKHISMSVGVIDKSIQRLKQKGYINTSTYNTETYIKHRTIFINWKKIEEVNELYLQSISNQLQTQNKAPQLTIISQPIPEIHVDEIVSEIEDKESIKLVRVDIPVPVIENKIDSIDLKNFNIDRLIEFDSKFLYEKSKVPRNKYFNTLLNLNNGLITFQQMIAECNEILINEQNKNKELV